jgi:hypothetical protein
MNRLLIGSSNVQRTYHPEKFNGYPPFNMIKCTKMVVFKALMDDINDEKEIIIYVMENFLCDAVRGVQTPTAEQIDKSIESVINEFMGVIGKTATKLPETRFALVQPILRPKHDWYTERYEGICRAFVAGVNGLGLENVSKLEAMSKSSQTFQEDQIHLTGESGKHMLMDFYSIRTPSSEQKF